MTRKVYYCTDCRRPLSMGSNGAKRCRSCYQKDLIVSRAGRSAPVDLAPFGLIRIPEGVSVYYVRKGDAI